MELAIAVGNIRLGGKLVGEGVDRPQAFLESQRAGHGSHGHIAPGVQITPIRYGASQGLPTSRTPSRASAVQTG